MKILGIDFGKAKIGLAISEGILAEPLAVLKYDDLSKAIEEIAVIIESEEVDCLVVGVPSGSIGQQVADFAERLEEAVGLPTLFQDETLTTKDAQEKALEAGIKRVKRKEKEDAYAAAVMLQRFLESQDDDS